MSTIEKAKFRNTGKVITVEQYEEYINDPKRRYIKPVLECIECGDEILFAHGDHNEHYFKHKSNVNGHDCSLYKGVIYANSCTQTTYRKLVKENNINLNFELIYNQGLWQGLITLPPFSEKEIRENTRNNTKIIIDLKDFRYKKREKLLNSDNILPGEIVKILIPNLTHQITLSVTGNDLIGVKREYTIDGFEPDYQVFECLLLQNYSDRDKKHNNSYIFKKLSFKRITGNVFVGRHYIIFSRKNIVNFATQQLNNVFKGSDKIKLNIDENKDFPYEAYEVIIKENSEEIQKFFGGRFCEVLDDDFASILWPPLNTVGNYKYNLFDETNPDDFRKLIVSYENEYNTHEFELLDDSTDGNLFELTNKNIAKIYLSGKKVDEEKNTLAKIESIKKDSFVTKQYTYLFKNGFLINSLIPDRLVNVEKNEKFLIFNTTLDRTFITNDENVITDKAFQIIRYSHRYVTFRKLEYEYLINKIKDKKIIDYLELCFKRNSIKEDLKDFLMSVED